jgi:hypothetical protein
MGDIAEFERLGTGFDQLSAAADPAGKQFRSSAPEMRKTQAHLVPRQTSPCRHRHMPHCHAHHSLHCRTSARQHLPIAVPHHKRNTAQQLLREDRLDSPDPSIRARQQTRLRHSPQNLSHALQMPLSPLQEQHHIPNGHIAHSHAVQNQFLAGIDRRQHALAPRLKAHLSRRTQHLFGQRERHPLENAFFSPQQRTLPPGLCPASILPRNLQTQAQEFSLRRLNCTFPCMPLFARRIFPVSAALCCKIPLHTSHLPVTL